MGKGGRRQASLYGGRVLKELSYDKLSLSKSIKGSKTQEIMLEKVRAGELDMGEKIQAGELFMGERIQAGELDMGERIQAGELDMGEKTGGRARHG